MQYTSCDRFPGYEPEPRDEFAGDDNDREEIESDDESDYWRSGDWNSLEAKLEEEEARAEAEREAAEFMESGADRCPPRE